MGYTLTTTNQAKMGKKDKHKQEQSRNNPVFKVANGRLSKQKGKAKEVSTKLKKISNETRKAVDNADVAFKALQKDSISQGISMTGKVTTTKTKIEPSNVLKKEDNPNTSVNSLLELMETTSTSAKS